MPQQRKKEKPTAKRAAYMGMLTALAFIFSYIESLFPIQIGVSGVKLGLANLVVMVALYLMGTKEAFLLSLIRIVLSGLTFSNPAAMVYSLAGGMLSLFVMVLAKKGNVFSVTGVSVLGGVFHNAGQLLAAIVIVETKSLVYYLPVLILAGTLAGAVIGAVAAMVIKRLQKYQ